MRTFGKQVGGKTGQPTTHALNTFAIITGVCTKLSPSLLSQMVYVSKEAAGNPRSTAAHAKVEQSANLLTEAVVDLTQLLEKAGGDAGLISGTVTHHAVQEGGESLTICLLVLYFVSVWGSFFAGVAEKFATFFHYHNKFVGKSFL